MPIGAAASDFGYDRAARHERLLSDLVFETLNSAPGERAHEMALEHCLHQTKHHRFADADPKQVDRLFSDLAERLLSLAQHGKRKALLALVNAVQQVDLNSDTLEVNHSILSALYYCSGHPLNAIFEPGPATEELLDAESKRTPEEESQEILAAWKSELMAVNSVTSEDAPNSDLSAWSDEDDAHVQPHGSTHADCKMSHEKQPNEVSSQLPVHQVFEPESLCCKRIRSTYAPIPKLKGRQDGVGMVLPGCLFDRLAKSRCSELAFALPLGKKCTSEPHLAVQVLSMFRGSKDPGPAFAWDSKHGEFRVTEGVHVPHMSPAALRNLLATFSPAGSIAVRLLGIVEGTHIGRVQDAYVSEAPTWTAFVAAVGKQLQALNQHLISVELQPEREQPVSNLLQLRQALQSPMRELRLLNAVVTEAAPTQEYGTPSERSGALLSLLHRWLSKACCQTRLQGASQAASLLKLFSGALKPMLEALDGWLRDAVLPTSHGEFFVKHDESIVPEAKEFWAEAYKLKQSKEGVSACPDFLLPIAEELLDSGKSLILLRRQTAMSSEQSKEAAEKSHFQASLYLSFITALKEQAKVSSVEKRKQELAGPREKSCFLEVPDLPIADRMATASHWYQPAPELLQLSESKGQTNFGGKGSSLHIQDETWRPGTSGSHGSETAADLSDAWPGNSEMQSRLQRVADALQSPANSHHSCFLDGLDLGSLQASFLDLYTQRLTTTRNTEESRDESSQQQDLQEWLDAIQAVALPPCKILLQRCLIDSLESRVQHTGKNLLLELKGRWELNKQLRSLRGIFLGGAPVLLPFAYSLAERLVSGQELVDIPATELQDSLQSCLEVSSQLAPLPPGTTFSATVDEQQYLRIQESLKAAESKRRAKLSTAASGTSKALEPLTDLPRTLVELKALFISCQMPWPLALVVDSQAMQLYNAVLVFLLQLRWAQEAVRAGQVYGGRNQAFNSLHPLSHRLLYLITSLEQFVMRTVAAAWQRLEKEMEVADSLPMVQEAHLRFLEAAAQPCMASPEGSWHVIYSVLRKLLDMCLAFRELAPMVQDAITGERGLGTLAKLSADFADRHRYLLKSLTAKSLKIDDQSGLQHLVMLLNFNDHYQ